MQIFGSRLRSRAAIALTSASLVLTPAVALPTVSPASAAAAACSKATIGGKSKCIAVGQFCAKRYESDYRDYGYTCNKKDRNGRWHLQAR